MLVESDRVKLLPEIAQMFDELKDRFQGSAKAEIESAFELSAAQLAELTSALERRFGKRIEAHGAGLILVGDTWYWIGEDKSGNSSAFKAVNAYASKDLATCLTLLPEIVFRRAENAFLSKSSSTCSGRASGTSRTMADSTLGGGRKAPFGTLKSFSIAKRACSATERRP